MHFSAILEDLIRSKRLQGTLVGGRQEKASYIPDVYTRAQNQWVDSFYQQNGYLGKGSAGESVVYTGGLHSGAESVGR